MFEKSYKIWDVCDSKNKVNVNRSITRSDFEVAVALYELLGAWLRCIHGQEKVVTFENTDWSDSVLWLCIWTYLPKERISWKCEEPDPKEKTNI